MDEARQCGMMVRAHTWNLPAKSVVVLALALCASACGSRSQVRIAVIPQTEGTLLWENAHVGAAIAASDTGAFIYWNAPTREDDVEAQIALVDRVVDSGFQGLVLAPDQALALISPVRRALAHGISTVIIGSPLPIPAGGNLSYILNDDREGSQMAAKRVGELLRGHGTVAILGIDADVTGTSIRARAFEQFLAEHYAGIQIVDRRMGSYNFSHEQQVAEETLRAHPNLDVIVDLMSPSVDGTLSALNASPGRRAIKVIGFDLAGLPSFQRNPNLDCVIQADTRSMGQRAIELIHARLLGQTAPYLTTIPPKLITQANINSDEVRGMLSQDWTLGRRQWSPSQ
jgi:ribose transport system substrate-binding protein